MSDAAAPLLELLRTLAPPLQYLAADGFRRSEQTRLPLAALADRIARARAGKPPSAVAAVLDELDAVVGALAEAAAEQRAGLLRRAWTLLPALQRAAEARSEADGGRGAARAAGTASPAPVATGEARAPTYRASAASLDGALAALRQPAEAAPGVGPKRAAELARFGIATVEDLLYHLPFRYEDRRIRTPLRALRPGDEATAEAVVAGVRQGMAGRRGRRILEVVVRDEGGTLVLVWFQQVAWFAGRFAVGQRLVVHGRVEPPLGRGPYRMVHPDVAVVDGEAAPPPSIVPVYEKPTAMYAAQMRRLVHGAVEAFADRVPGAVPAAVARRQRIVDPARALRYVHAPPAEADLRALDAAASLAHRSLVFDELFFLQLGLALRRAAVDQEPGTPYAPPGALVAGLRAALPFRPTAAQERAFGEIAEDLARPHPMRRLLQGDVGSGKTLVALMAALTVVECGGQAAMMAPTELLAEQHWGSVGPQLQALGLDGVLLTGAVKGRARRDALAALRDGSAALAVGTHALIQEGVEFARLGLAVVDEQHRFGVLQRAALQRRGGAVDVLVMSATPIPRTLALTLYGDLAVSTLDELPPGRTPIATRLCREARKDDAYARIREEVAAGHQAYVVYPLVEESEKTPLKAATTMAQALADGPLAGLRVGLVHGRMKSDEKDAVMRRFAAGAVDVLVTTTVIEVGIDVPNATVIAIEHAERFGLAQLHQLRGRVGRGAAPSHCMLVVGDDAGAESMERLRVLEQTTDGFRIADADLAIRGPGDFLGTRQAGLPPFRVANLVRDTALLRAARDEALAWLEHDPTLATPESAAVVAVLRHRWAGRLELARVG